MSRMFVPKSVRAMGTLPNISELNGLKYLVGHLKRIVISDKHINDNRILVLDVRHETSKRSLARALNSISSNTVKGIRSLNRKGETKRKGVNTIKTESYKRVYVNFESDFDKSILVSGGSQ